MLTIKPASGENWINGDDFAGVASFLSDSEIERGGKSHAWFAQAFVNNDPSVRMIALL